MLLSANKDGVLEDIFVVPHLDLKSIIVILIIMVAAVLLSKFARWSIDKFFISTMERMDIDPTRFKYFKNSVSFIIWLFAIATIVLQIPTLKTLAITLFAGAGIIVASLGFAAQKAFSNIISGIVMIIFEPFKVGDTIQVGEKEYGIVEDITLRHTVLNNLQNKRIIIPNSVISSENIVNETHENSNVCKWIDFGISYDSDVKLAIRIIQEVAMQHPNCVYHEHESLEKLNEPKVVVRVMSYGDFSVNLRAYVWTDDPLYLVQMQSDINKAVKKRFDKEGVEIPFPYRTLVFKEDIKREKQELLNR